MATPQLVYFNVRGRGEAIRYLAKDNGVALEEVDCWQDWPTRWKPQMAFGQAPQFKDGDLTLVQSNAILRYLGRKHGLYGSNNQEAAYIDMIMDSVEDLRMKYVHVIYKDWENGREPYIASLPEQLGCFEKQMSKLGDANAGFCVGKKSSIADYCLFDILDNNLILAPKCLDDFPALSAFHKAVESRPGIAAHRGTEAFKKRKVNGNNNGSPKE